LSTFEKGQKMAKWPNLFISGKQIKKGQIWQIWPLKRPNGNPDLSTWIHHSRSLALYVFHLLFQYETTKDIRGHSYI